MRNAALTEVRNKKTGFSPVYTELLPNTASYNPFAEKEWNDVYELLDKLPVTTRAVCILYYNEGFSIKEISLVLEMKEGTVKWHLNDGRNRLKKIFTPNFNKSEG